MTLRSPSQPQPVVLVDHTPIGTRYAVAWHDGLRAGEPITPWMGQREAYAAADRLAPTTTGAADVPASAAPRGGRTAIGASSPGVIRSGTPAAE